MSHHNISTQYDTYAELQSRYDARWGKRVRGGRVILLMRCGTYYECYAVEAKDGQYEGGNIAVFHNVTQLPIVKYGNFTDEHENQIVKCGCCIYDIGEFLKSLIEIHKYTVVVYDKEYWRDDNPLRLAVRANHNLIPSGDEICEHCYIIRSELSGTRHSSTVVFTS